MVEASSSYRKSFGKATIFHPAHVFEPGQASLGEDGERARHACLSQDGYICDPILPGDVQESSEVMHVKGTHPSLLVRVQGPGLTAI